jgi:predicted ArsR family transcriptional regulator
MKISQDSSDRQYLERLQRLGCGTVRQMCSEMGVTSTAVRQRLTRLKSLDLVEREVVRGGRGRPHYTYRVTEVGLKQLGENYADLAIILWQELRKIADPTIRERVLRQIQEALVSRYGSIVTNGTLNERLQQLEEALVERGFDVEVDATGQVPILRENSCPYLELAATDHAICDLEQAVFRRVLDANVTLTQCCLDGHCCCEFQATDRVA